MITTIASTLDNILRVATHQSLLALWQAHCVKDKLMANHPGLVVKLAPMVTRGDVVLNTPLTEVGGKGLFVKKLEIALLEDRADIAVHPMKDIPVEFPQSLGLVIICEHEDPCDAFVSNNYDSLDALLADSIVGTSSLRRQCQLAEHRLDLIIRSLRGNVDTRLNRLGNGEYDAVILVIAGLKRLGLESCVHATLPPEISLPAVGQDAAGIGCHLGDSRTRKLLTALNYHGTTLRITAEHAMNARLEGGCQVPIGNYAELIDGEIWLRVLVGTPDGSQIICGERRDALQDAKQMGISLAKELLNNGAREVLTEIYNGDAPA